MLRVLLAGPIPPPEGGVATSMKNLHAAVKDDVETELFDTSSHRAVGLAGQWSIPNITGAIGLIPQYRRSLRRGRPDVVHIETGGYLGPLKSAALLLAAGPIPTVLSLHSPHIGHDLAAAGIVGRQIIFRALMRATMIRVEHRGQEAELRALHRGLRHAAIEVIPNLIHLEANASPAVDASPPASDRFTLVTVGSVGTRKGTYDLLRAVGVVADNRPTIQCHILGPEERPGDLDALQALRDSLGLRDCVSLGGATDHLEVLDALRTAQAFVLPGYAEGLPLALLEAMAAGLPVLATDVGGIADAVRQPELSLLSPGQPDQLAAAIIRLIDDPGLRARCGHANRRRILTALAPAKLGAEFVSIWQRAAKQVP